MSDSAQLRDLMSGRSYRFEGWPIDAVPNGVAGVYTIWDASEFLYVGMAGGALSSKSEGSRSKSSGLRARLASHASGRRSGDQFCVYLCDRRVLPTLTTETIQRIAAGSERLDELTRRFVRDRLSFRFLVTGDSSAAREIESTMRRGSASCGQPTLNPL